MYETCTVLCGPFKKCPRVILTVYVTTPRITSIKEVIALQRVTCHFSDTRRVSLGRATSVLGTRGQHVIDHSVLAMCEALY